MAAMVNICIFKIITLLCSLLLSSPSFLSISFTFLFPSALGPAPTSPSLHLITITQKSNTPYLTDGKAPSRRSRTRSRSGSRPRYDIPRRDREEDRRWHEEPPPADTEAMEEDGAAGDDDPEMAMMRMMGFGGFDTTKVSERGFARFIYLLLAAYCFYASLKFTLYGTGRISMFPARTSRA